PVRAGNGRHHWFQSIRRPKPRQQSIKERWGVGEEGVGEEDQDQGKERNSLIACHVRQGWHASGCPSSAPGFARHQKRPSSKLSQIAMLGLRRLWSQSIRSTCRITSWCPKVRHPLQHPLTRTSEAKGH